MHGVAYLQRAAMALQSNPEQVTCFHNCYAKLCLKSKCYQHSLKLIEQSMTQVQGGTDAIEIITYNYYRGMLYTGLKRFNDAITCFSRVLSLPTKIYHKVHQESYKKLCLLNLIASNDAKSSKFRLPHTTSPFVRNHIEMETQQGEFERNTQMLVYQKIEQKYTACQPKELEKVIGEDFAKL